MKVLYVVKVDRDRCVKFNAVQVREETQEEFITIDKINIKEKDFTGEIKYKYINTFPKNKLNQELEMGYVTDKLDKEVLKTQIDRIYNKLQNNYRKMLEKNEQLYKNSIDVLNKCILPKDKE